jgi:hypothetical protein
MTGRALKVLNQTLTALHPSIRPFDDPTLGNGDKSSFALCYFFGFRRLGRKLESNGYTALKIEGSDHYPRAYYQNPITATARRFCSGVTSK